MFGYIRIYKPELKIKHFSEYKSIYCSICKYMGKSFGKITRFTLSYDSTFLAMLALSLSNKDNFKFSSSHCPLNPLKRCSFCNEKSYEIAFASSVSIILTHYKLMDDINDSKFFKKSCAYFLLKLLNRSYKKARKKFVNIDEFIGKQMQTQKMAESNPDASIDSCAEPSALILSYIAELLSSDIKQKVILKEFGYFLGRWIYLIDAADDLEKDFKCNNFNPFIKVFNLQKLMSHSELNHKIEPVLNHTLGRLISAYNLLDIHKFKDVLDNVIYYGLQETQKKVLNKEKSDICE